MTNQPKTIITYLVDGNPTGIKTVEFSNRLIKGLSIPRKDFRNALDRVELKFSGIYFLIGEDDDGNDLVYIGQATVLGKRLNDHFKDTSKDFWNNAICFTYKDGSLNESDINYLEKEIIKIAKQANRYIIANNTLGNNGLILEHRIGDMKEFIEDIKILTTNMGYPLLKELVSKKEKEESGNIYYLKSRGSDAKGLFGTDSYFLVLAGSKLSPNDIISYQKNLGHIERNRKKLTDLGIIKDAFFTKDHEFNTPTAACNIIAGGNQNGRLEWKDKNGKTLDENERKSLDS